MTTDDTSASLGGTVCEHATERPEQGNRAVNLFASAQDKTFKREATFTRAMIDEAGRTCELSFSSESPVDRGEYLEILSHDPANCDLSRLNNAHPLLLGHNPDEQIGVVEKAWIYEGKGRAIVRFSKSEDGEEIWQDVVDGIRRLVSVGYRIVRGVSCVEQAGREVCTFAWQPYEISIVSVPADASVGIGRKLETKKEQITMSETKVESVVEQRDYKKEAAEIMAISKNLSGKVENVNEIAFRAISEGKTADQFRAEALNQLPALKPVQVAPLSEVKARDWAKYSITRAIGMQMPGAKQDGIEAEMHQELKRDAKRQPEGILIPDQVFTRNHVAGTNTLGGFLVQTENLGSEFIEILRNRSQVLNLGARVLSLTGPVTIPRQNGAGTVNWVGESVASTITATNFQQLTLTPQAVSAYQQYSKMLLMESNPSIDSIVREDIMQTIALEIDRVALHGSGSGQPTGIAATSGIGTVLGATDSIVLSTYGATCYPALVSLESAVAGANADAGSLAYLLRPQHRGVLKGVQRFASTDTPVFNDGQINGYRAEVSNQVANNLTTGTATTICSAIFFGNWNELLIASFGSTDLVVDPYTAGANGVVRLYARRWVDIGVRHAASFAILGGIR